MNVSDILNKPLAKICIADDMPITVNLIERIISDHLREKFSLTFINAKNGMEVLDIWETYGEPDILIADLHMPLLDGLTTIKYLTRKFEINGRLISKPVTCPIIVVTGMADNVTIENAYVVGASSVIIKPFSSLSLATQVERLLYLHKKATCLEYSGILTLCKTIEKKDDVTGKHVDRIGSFTQAIAEEMGFNTVEAGILSAASKLHDIGKINIPDNILQKNGPLSLDEMSTIKSHTTVGYEIIRHCDGQIFADAKDIVRFHHEKVDGTGYPLGLTGKEIPVSAKIAAVADVYDALTSTRPYKPSWEHKKAIEYMVSNRSTHFDSDTLDAFLSLSPRNIHSIRRM